MNVKNPLVIIVITLILGGIIYWVTAPVEITKSPPPVIEQDTTYDVMTMIQETTAIEFTEIDLKEFSWHLYDENDVYMTLMISGKRMSAKLISEEDHFKILTTLEEVGFTINEDNTTFNDSSHVGTDAFEKEGIVCEVEVAYQLESNERTGLVNSIVRCGLNLYNETVE